MAASIFSRIAPKAMPSPRVAFSPQAADRRSAAADAWRKLYWTPFWRSLRKAQLTKQPLCERCLKAGAIVAATVVNHVKPHKGDRALFEDPSNLQSMCKPCHDGPTQRKERSGRDSPHFDTNGRVIWPD